MFGDNSVRSDVAMSGYHLVEDLDWGENVSGFEVLVQGGGSGVCADRRRRFKSKWCLLGPGSLLPCVCVYIKLKTVFVVAVT